MYGRLPACTDCFGVFHNRDSLLRLATAVLVKIDEDWETSNRIYINWDNPDA
jgi:hypothetical protein